ncbi:MAG: thioredoxin [Pseudomonadota bacterium]|nr:thioredoxin [Pseudomonadota bacterium]
MSQSIQVTESTFRTEVSESALPVVVDLWAPWCGPCRAMAPVLDELAVRYAGRVKVVKVNVDEEPGIASAFKLQGIPTLAVVRGNAVVDGQIGFTGRAGIEQLFARVAAPQDPA